MEMLRPIGEEILEAAKLEEGYTVLDVATGTGEPGLSAAKRVVGGEVVGVDLSEAMLAIANEKAKRLRIKNYRTVLLNSSSLPFADDSFDAVTCRFGVMFFPDILTGLREMVRVLKPRRRLALSVWGPMDERAKAVQETIEVFPVTPSGQRRSGAVPLLGARHDHVIGPAVRAPGSRGG